MASRTSGPTAVRGRPTASAPPATANPSRSRSWLPMVSWRRSGANRAAAPRQSVFSNVGWWTSMPSAGGALRAVLPGSGAALSPVSNATVASLSPKLVAVPGNEIPPGMICDRLMTRDGVALRYAIAPGPSLSKGTVCVLQGRGEFIERYFETVRDLRSRGYTVATLDWRGQGGSARLLRQSWRGHIRRFRQYDIDLETFMREIVLPDCPPPFYAIGHSTGGQILLRALRRHR